MMDGNAQKNGENAAILHPKYSVMMKKIFLLLCIFSSLQLRAQTVNLPCELLWAERTSATKYVLHTQVKGKWKIFVGKNPEAINWSVSAKTLKDSLSIDVLPTDRLFFAGVKKKDTLIFSERRLWVEGAPNFRDLGGLKTASGRTVAWGKLFRCGDMGQLTENDLSVLKNINVKNVVDFRNDQEVSKSTDKYPINYDLKRVWASITATNSQSMMKFYQVMGNPKATPEEVEVLFENLYATFPDQIKNYGPFFQTLLEDAKRGATLYHCTAGKDRTGLASALVLSILGVPEEVIISEYYLSNRYTKDAMAKSPMMASLKPELVSVLAGVKPEYIKSSLKTIIDKYGSVLKMLEQELGIGTAERQKLIDFYTY